jgi:large subunit ribosomal protein L21
MDGKSAVTTLLGTWVCGKSLPFLARKGEESRNRESRKSRKGQPGREEVGGTRQSGCFFVNYEARNSFLIFIEVLTMYAIIAADGRQYKVQTGDEIQLDFQAERNPGEQISLDRVLLISGPAGVQVGQPTIAGASVAAEVLSTEQGDKIYIQKMRRRKNFRRRTGHRQDYTKVRIGAITS